MAAPMLGRRYELKFPLTAADKAAILDAGRPGLEPDPHGAAGLYRVSSLYFDTPDLVAYWQKLDGEEIRAKFRLRYYGLESGDDAAVGAAFMEIKRRANNTVLKERVRLTPEGAAAILDDDRELARIEQHVIPAARAQRATIDAIRRAAAAPGFGGVGVVTYRREAWMGRVDPRLRVTFDHLCRAYPPAAWLDVADETGPLLHPPTRVIMEVKFDRAIPRWIRDVVARSGVRLQRFSKYAAAVEALGLVEAGGRRVPVARSRAAGEAARPRRAA